MAYQTAITIADAIRAIQKGKYVLPSIQREFVWNTEQIERLFDSIMRDYPISTFLFWNVQKERINDFQFYAFLKDYHEKTQRHNTKVDLSNDEDVIAVLDGQQRLTSIYLALRGTFAEKLPYHKWESVRAFPKKKLFLNLIAPADDIELNYDFCFLTDDERNEKPGVWFEVGKILDFHEVPAVMRYLMQNGLMDTSKYKPSEADFALTTLTNLYNVIHQKGTISYYLEQSAELDKVLQIFIRINSGGTKLSYSDLLLSIATAQWSEIDAREAIHKFVDEINLIGSGFSFNKDFVLKSCLVLGDFNDIKFKVDNFSKENMLKIEQQWSAISGAIRLSIQLISRFGFNRDNLTTANAVIPIAYYIYKNKIDENYLSSANKADDKNKVKEWLLRVILKKSFGGTPDSLYPVLRRLINENLGGFPLDKIVDYYKGHVKSITFSEDDIDALLNVQYGSAFAFAALSLVYDGLNLSFRYHQDHVFPKKYFHEKRLHDNGIPSNRIPAYLEEFNKLANLQLLEAVANQEKSSTLLDQWLKKNYPSVATLVPYKTQHSFPLDAGVALNDFIDFNEKRKNLLRDKFETILNVKKAASIAPEQP